MLNLKNKLLLILFVCVFPFQAFADPVTSQYLPNAIMRTTPGYAAKDLYAILNVAASQTDTSIIAAVTGKKIRVTGWGAVCGAVATNLTFNSKGIGAGVAITPLFANGANGGEVFGFNPMGWFETVSSEALTVTTGAGSTTGILVTYTTY